MFNKEKDYFKNKLKGIQAMIWDLEFKNFRTGYVREQIRQEYDGLRSRQEILKTNIKVESEPGKLKDTNLDEFKRLEDDDVRLTIEIDRKVAQMKQLDIEISGASPSAELPEGHQGTNQTLEALRELIQVTKHYIKQL